MYLIEYTRERTRQIEVKTLKKLKNKAGHRNAQSDNYLD